MIRAVLRCDSLGPIQGRPTAPRCRRTRCEVWVELLLPLLDRCYPLSPLLVASMAVSILPLLGTSLPNPGPPTAKPEPGMPRALLTTLATKNRRLQILDHTRVPLHLEEDISVRASCWNLARVGHCQACQFLKGLDPLLVQAISRT